MGRISRTIAIAVAALSLFSAASCGGGDNSSPKTVLIFGTLDGIIVEYDLATNETTTLIASEPGSNAAVRDPAVSPAGTRIAYVYHPPGKTGAEGRDVGSDVWIANRDGSEPRPLYEHDKLTETVSFPQWEDEQHVLVVDRWLPDPRSYVGVVYKLLRINVDDGTAATIREEVTSFGLSDDGEVAFSRVRVVGEGVEETLRIGAAGEAEARELVSHDAGLGFLGFPRVSPDGKRVAFFALNRKAFLAPKQPSEHTPAELWLVDIEEGTTTKVTDFDAREGSPPSIAWQSDGERLYVAGEAGVFDVDLDEGFAKKLSDVKAASMISLADAR